MTTNTDAEQALALLQSIAQAAVALQQHGAFITPPDIAALREADETLTSILDAFEGDDEEEERLLTYEHCTSWSQVWTAEVEDDCPVCGVSVTPQYTP